MRNTSKLGQSVHEENRFRNVAYLNLCKGNPTEFFVSLFIDKNRFTQTYLQILFRTKLKELVPANNPSQDLQLATLYRYQQNICHVVKHFGINPKLKQKRQQYQSSSMVAQIIEDADDCRLQILFSIFIFRYYEYLKQSCTDIHN